MCDQITEEMSALKKRRREVEVELKMWKRKVQKVTWYNQKKTRTRSASESDEGQRCITPLSPKSPVFSSPTPSPMSSLCSPPGISFITPSSTDCSGVDVHAHTPSLALLSVLQVLLSSTQCRCHMH